VPGQLDAALLAPAPIPSVPPRVLAGIPADLLRRRPDVRAAERALAAATARIGVATADLYPTFGLSGSVGLESLEASDFLKYDSRFLGLSPAVSWPVFRAGSIRANIEIQNARQEQALAAYEQAVLAAVQELRDALSDYGREYARLDSLTRAAESAEDAMKLAQNQYVYGLADFNAVLDAQRSLTSFRESIAVSEGAITAHLIRVYKALGGGWAPLAD
jgi:outer membrane protein TolC